MSLFGSLQEKGIPQAPKTDADRAMAERSKADAAAKEAAKKAKEAPTTAAS